MRNLVCGWVLGKTLPEVPPIYAGLSCPSQEARSHLIGLVAENLLDHTPKQAIALHSS
ncbi:hypothetical protein [Coleofasciculus sp.]|uniref:hypothetical protein n=1 Tax=Coleofasciculus sp. TaxID=3100458 RepID=UPI0039F75214